MLTFVRKHHSLLFFLGWLTINIIQAGFTELIDDEAYYWVYSRFPDWGYFDHPPMIAILIRLGYGLFGNALGVRLFAVLLNTATIYITRQLLPKQNDYLFYAVAATIAVAQIGGIIAAPDAPLIFTIALFFLLYKRFREQLNITNTLLLGAGMALMLYSKYHGVLIIFFTLLSDLTLFKRYQTYLAGLVTLLLFMPHIYWQFTHGFPSVQYHLFERNASEYKISYTVEYLLGQIALTGPLMGWLLLWAALQFKPVSPSERAMKFSLAGIYAFFLLMTFKGRVEANWTLPAFIPLMVLSHQYLNNGGYAQKKWLIKMVPLTLGLVLLVRIYLLSFIPSTGRSHKADEVHGNKTWVKAVEERAAGLPVVFINSYQRASKFWFYAQQPAYSLNGVDYRRNNFNFWPVEDSFMGKKVMVISRTHPRLNANFDRPIPHTDSLISFVSEKFFAFSRVMLTATVKPRLQNGMFTGTFSIQSPEHYLAFYKQLQNGQAGLVVSFITDNHLPYNLAVPFSLKDVDEVKQQLSINIPVSLPPGRYDAKLGISSSIPEVYTLNSTSFGFTIK
ncbi:ArnT family glycosyltransferase [Pseudoflavitalea rhizosphaerae]|uniref:ArnT family glycosyltransferase n=1 Tax=Pseudoflavitalea rhizosphaerae TaxID=1884793 RepID=UPI000F8D20AC|nr:glycosyltransferase family 39 protein [Pseudoflavitalea rhizosphaerae]